MENPFVYGRYVSGEAFTDREEELAYLVRESESNGRIFLISPRRYGKSSLLQRARQELLKKGILVAYFDLYKIDTMNQFAEAYASAILNASKSKSRKFMKWVTDFLPRLRPKISFEAPEAPSVSLDYSFEQAVRNLVLSYAPLFAEIWDTLTLFQQKLLKAIAQTGGAALTSARNLKCFELRSSSAVSRGLKLLRQKGVVDRENDKYGFTDIFFEKWVKMGR